MWVFGFGVGGGWLMIEENLIETHWVFIFVIFTRIKMIEYN